MPEHQKLFHAVIAALEALFANRAHVTPEQLKTELNVLVQMLRAELIEINEMEETFKAFKDR